MLRCVRCLLPALAPGAELDRDRICAPCHAFRPGNDSANEAARRNYEADLERTLVAARGAGKHYDALVCLSGGKDSLYLLHRAVVDYGLRVLAFTTDANLPPIAWSNIERTVAKLRVDHLIYRPANDFYRKLFRFLLENQEARGAVYTVSYVYAPLFEGDALAAAMARDIPIILAGYSPGQPEPERMVYEFDQALVCSDWTPPGLRESGQFTDAELARFWDASRYGIATNFPRYIAPFHAWVYNQDETIKRVTQLGLVKTARHASPIFSNYPINWLLMYSDLRHFGFNPYAPEFAALIREGKASLTYWKIAGPIVDFMIRRRVGLGRTATEQMRWLGLDAHSLKVNRPQGAYDPDFVRQRAAR